MSKSSDIRRRALNLLARREHSAAELLQKLRAKGFMDGEIHPLLKTLEHEGLLNNARFVENYVHYRRTKGYGPIRIRHELIERGIAEDLIEHHINIADNAWLTDVRQVWEKRFKNQLPHDFKTRAQQMRFLQHRGFTQKQIESIYSDKES